MLSAYMRGGKQMLEVSKWIEIARECDDWRAQYDEYDFETMKQYYNNLFKRFPTQRRFNYPWFVKQFESLKRKELCVIEFGGYDGELARNILTAYPNIKTWSNWDFTENHLPISEKDAYYYHISEAYIWDDFDPRQNKTHVFVSAHTIEHISNEHFDLLYKNVISKCNYALLEIPIPDSLKPNWEGYAGTHILDMHWVDICERFVDWSIKDRTTKDCGALVKT